MDGGSVVWGHEHEVDFEVGDDDGFAVGVGKGDGVVDVSVAVAEVDEAWGAVGVGLWAGLEVGCGVGAEALFEWIGFVGSAFLSASCFSSLCHVQAVKVKE